MADRYGVYVKWCGAGFGGSRQEGSCFPDSRTAQAGFNVKLRRGLALNFDAQHAALRSDVSIQGGPRLTPGKLDPRLFSIVLGWRF